VNKGMAAKRLNQILLLAFLVLIQSQSAHPQEQPPLDQRKTLAEVRDKRRALLMVFRSGVLDATNNERAIVDQVLKADPEPKGRNRWVYGQIAKRLNDYIRKYRSLTPATELSEADYVIYFNLIEFRRILNVIYPYGELFVIVKESPETHTPGRVIWKAKKVLWAGDAINDLIKDLKNVRGEG
jgi:hypothetical protein